MKIEWKEPTCDNGTCFTADHGGRHIEIVYDECRGLTTLDIEDQSLEPEGISRAAIVKFDTGISAVDVKLAQHCAQAICDEQDRIDEAEGKDR